MGYSDQLNNAFRIAKTKLPMVMLDVLQMANGLQYAVSILGQESDNKSSNSTVYFVLHSIMCRTLPFGKFFESVTHAQIVSGMINLAIAPALVSPFQVKNVLPEIRPPSSDILIKLRFRNIVTPCYSLNWPGVFGLICQCWLNDLSELQEQRQRNNGDLTLSNNCLMGFSKAVLCAKYLLPYRPAFKFLLSQTQVIDSVDELLNNIRQRIPKRRQTDFNLQLSECNKPGKLRKEWKQCLERNEYFRDFDPQVFHELFF